MAIGLFGTIQELDFLTVYWRAASHYFTVVFPIDGRKQMGCGRSLRAKAIYRFGVRSAQVITCGCR